jgi:hypothetical protein
VHQQVKVWNTVQHTHLCVWGGGGRHRHVEHSSISRPVGMQRLQHLCLKVECMRPHIKSGPFRAEKTLLCMRTDYARLGSHGCCTLHYAWVQ